MQEDDARQLQAPNAVAGDDERRVGSRARVLLPETLATFFPPLEVMFQETSNAVMGALLIHDIRNEDAASHPSYELENPLQLFQHGSFHGGIWRSAYQIGSTAETTVILYHIANNSVLIFIVLLAAAYGYLNFL